MNNVPSAKDCVDLENHWDDPAVFPYEIHSVLILRHPSLTKNYWTVPSWGWIRENFSETLQDIIKKKELLLQNYDTGCKEMWLLVVAEHNSSSAFFDPSAVTLNHSYKSTFKRIFFLDLFSRKVSELKLIPT